MAGTITTTYMSMPSPIPTTEPGPDWSYDISACLNIIDQHNHSPGQGQLIQPNGMNINDDLPFNSNNATLVRTLRFDPQSSAITNAAPDVGALYVVNNELYYNDVTGGNQVQITTNGNVNAGAGSISGLPSGTASAAYNAGTFTWESATNTAANMDFASAILRNSSASSFGLTLNPPAAMGADFSITLPSLPVGSTKIMQMDTSGNMSAAVVVDNATLQLSTNILSIKNSGVGTTQIADGAVTRPKLAASVFNPTITTITSTGSYVVPANCTQIYVEASGGGGGGGGGGSAAAASGGGGGGGAPVFTRWLTVVAGETLTVTIGTGGAGGAAQVSGTSGVSTTIVGSTSGALLTCLGGGGGGHGVSSSTIGISGLSSIGAGGGVDTSHFGLGGGGGGGFGPGGANLNSTESAPGNLDGSNGGGGSGGGTSVSSTNVGGFGAPSIYFSTKTSPGTSANSAGSGGGGGCSFAAGGAGGNGANTPTVGAAAAANSGGGGGGGGGSGDAGAGAAGGNGGSGKVIVYQYGPA